MSIPELQANGILPPGEHEATLDEAGSGFPFPRFFQMNRDGDPKGIIVVRLGCSV